MSAPPPPSSFWPEEFDFDLPCPPGNAFGHLARSAARAPGRPALHYYGAALRYGDLLAGAEALAGWLQRRCGIRRGDRVLLAMQNSPQFVLAFQAILRADAAVVPVNPMNLTAELAFLAGDSDARVALIGDELVPAFAPLVPGSLEQVIVARYADALPDGCDDPLPAVMRRPPQPLPPGPWTPLALALAAGLAPGPIRTDEGDLAVLPYTSGSTGRPKACIHPHASVSFTAAAQARWYGLDEGSTMTAFMPLFHVAGMQASMSAGLLAGAGLVLMTRWDRDLAPRLLARHRVTFWSAAPTMISDVLAGEGFEEDSLAALRVVTGGGAPMPEAMAARLEQRHGLRFCEGYGLTETISATHLNPLAAPRPQCLGIPIFGTHAAIVEPETLAPLPPGETGEILVSGPQVMRGYWRRPEADAAAFVERDGRRWLRTGDLGWMDGDGYYYLTDRLKRMINASGYKVWPAECEALLYRHPAVRECCVIAAPDPHRGETVKALVVLRPDAPDGIAAEDIVAFARTVMAPYKVPRLVAFVPELPRTGSNKIDWRSLQEAEWAGTHD